MIRNQQTSFNNQYFYAMKSNNESQWTAIKILKLIILVLSIAYCIYLFVVAYGTFYSPYVKAPYSQLFVMIFGILSLFLTILPDKVPHPNNDSHQGINQTDQPIEYAPAQKLYSKLILGIYLIIIGIITTISLIYRDIYITCVFWILAGIFHLIEFYQFQKDQHQIQDQAKTNSIIDRQLEINPNKQLQASNQNCSEKCKNCCTKTCCKTCCLIATVIFMTWFTVISLITALYFINYPLIGTTFMIANPRSSPDKDIKIHVYCSTTPTPSIYPTLFLENGGGGNLVGFLPLFQVLATKYNIQGCAYDRLGYGRSDKIIPNLTPKERADIPHQLIQQLKDKNMISQKIVYGGWSAGVQLSINYLNQYPLNISALIFLDGYPNYLVLQSIVNNLTTVIPDGAPPLSQILRIIEPFGVDLFFGGSSIANQTLNRYYEAYYKTGYLWETQTLDQRSESVTSWLTSVANAKGDAKPVYNNSTSPIELNWPNIEIPLLLLPASTTVYSSNGSETMYMLQMDKYLEKCTNVIKEMYIIIGDHGFVTVALEEVAFSIQAFLQKI